MSGLSERPFMDALAIRREGLTPPKAELDALYSAYLGQVEKMSDFVDQIKTKI